MATIHRRDPQCRTARTGDPHPSAYPSQVPWREYLHPCGCRHVPILGPGTADDGHAHIGVLLECLPVGNLLEFVEAGRIGGGCCEVMVEYAVASTLKLLRQK